MSAQSSLLYHYTTGAGLKGIIESRNFWATHYKFLNDTSECKFVGQLVRAPLLELVIEEFKQQESQLDPEEAADIIWRTMTIALDKLWPPFIASFCRHSTKNSADGLLSQWRSYANDRGYCLCLDENELTSALRTDEKIAPTIYDVEYVDPKGYDFDGKEISGFLQDARNIINGSSDKFNRSLDFILKNVARFKHSAFHEENEIRVVYFRSLATLDDEFPMQFTVCNQTIVPRAYILKGGVSLPIREIIVGPGFDQTKRAAGLELFLKQQPDENVRKIPVRCSDIPYSNF